MRVALLQSHALGAEKCGGDISEACQHDVSKANRKEYGSLRQQYSGKRNDPYTHFSQQFHNKLMWLVIFYYFFTKTKQNKTKKIIKYYQPRQLVVGLL
jgi:hypothetical protein